MTGMQTPVRELQPGQQIHIQPHDVYRDCDHPWHIACETADVQVDWVTYRENVIVIVIYHDPSRPAVTGSTPYDYDDFVAAAA